MEEGKGMDSPCIAMNKPPKFGGKRKTQVPKRAHVGERSHGNSFGQGWQDPGWDGMRMAPGGRENGSAWSQVWGRLGDSLLCDTGFGGVCTQGDGGVGATPRLAECWGSCEGVRPSVFFLEGLGWMQTPSCSKLPSPWCPQSSGKCSSGSREGAKPLFCSSSHALALPSEPSRTRGTHMAWTTGTAAQWGN